jgi:geranylgeranyl diphosphate synthase type II
MNDRTAQYRAYIEDYLNKWYARFDTEPQSKLFDAMRYSLLAGGKRLRPVLAFEFCRMCGGEWEKAAPYAAAIEMIHTYSLIHDDLPCMDNDDYRRGRLTNHKVYGEAMAILAGDALLTDAFAVASTGGNCRAMAVLAECAGSLGMVGGQVLDIMSEERELSEQEVIDVQSRKTGALIHAACVMGVLAGGGSEAQVEAATTFAGALGMAFQIRDDMLDVIGDAQELGKAVGVDAQKNTFVRLYGLEKCEELVRIYTETAIRALSAFSDCEYMVNLAMSLTGRTV